MKNGPFIKAKDDAVDSSGSGYHDADKELSTSNYSSRSLFLAGERIMALSHDLGYASSSTSRNTSFIELTSASHPDGKPPPL